MTREQRTTIARAVGSLLAIGAMATDNRISDAIHETAQNLNRMVEDDIYSQISTNGVTITCNAEGEVDET